MTYAEWEIVLHNTQLMFWQEAVRFAGGFLVVWFLVAVAVFWIRHLLRLRELERESQLFNREGDGRSV